MVATDEINPWVHNGAEKQNSYQLPIEAARAAIH